MKCFVCSEPLREYRNTPNDPPTIERSVFRTEITAEGFNELNVHPRCAKEMYGKYMVLGHVLQSKADYPVRPAAKWFEKEVKLRLSPAEVSKEMDVAEMVGIAKSPCTDITSQGFTDMLAFHGQEGKLWPGRHHALKNDVAAKGKKAKTAYIPEALSDARDRGDVTRLIKGKLLDEHKKNEEG
jgi:hypothetical protein